MSTSFQSLPRAVTFDCWQTLIFEERWETAHGMRVAALEQAARSASRELAAGEAARAFDAAWGRHMELWAGEVATGAREVAHWALEEIGLDPQGSQFEPLLKSFEEASHSGRVRMIEGALTTPARRRAALSFGVLFATVVTLPVPWSPPSQTA